MLFSLVMCVSFMLSSSVPVIGDHGGDPIKNLDLDCDVPASQDGPPSEDRAVGYASDPQRVLVRWHFRSADPKAVTYTVVRTLKDAPPSAGSLLGNNEVIFTVAPSSSLTLAKAYLDGQSRWPGLGDHLIEIAAGHAAGEGKTIPDFASAVAHLWTNTSLLEAVSNAYYPVAEIMGRGLVDTTAAPGQEYKYAVVATIPTLVGVTTKEFVGDVGVHAGFDTPLAQPSKIEAIDTTPGGQFVPPRDHVWDDTAAAQELHERVFLLITTSQGPEPDCLPEAWLVGYDVFRIDQPIVHETPLEPVSVANGGGDSPTPIDVGFPYDLAVDVGAPGTFRFCATSRDLLGQTLPAALAETKGACSDATAHDLIPPGHPSGLNVEPGPTAGSLRISWNAPPGPAPSHYEVWRATTALAAEAMPCPPNTACWELVVITPGTEASDVPGTYGRYWYRVVAVDGAGNRGLPAGPEDGLLVDARRPPPPVASAAAAVVHLDVVPSAVTVDRLRLLCFLPGTTEYAFIEERSVSSPDFDLSHAVASGVPTTFPCVGQALATTGTQSGHSNPAIVKFWPGDPGGNLALPVPALKTIPTVPTADGPRPELQWSTPTTKGFSAFEIMRTELGASGASPQFTIVPGSATTSYLDATALAGQPYTYEVRTMRFFVNTWLRSEWSNRAAWVGGEGDYRHLREMNLLGAELGFDGDARGIYLEWECDWCGNTSKALIMRSDRSDQGFHQVAPVLDVAQKPGSPSTFRYGDPGGEPGRHWYKVLDLDPQTGEVRATSQAMQAQGTARVMHAQYRSWWDQVGWGAEENHDLFCFSQTVDNTAPIRLADGILLSPDWSTVSHAMTVFGPAIDGMGTIDVEVPTASGNQPLTLQVSFDEIRVNHNITANAACAGYAQTLDGTAPIEIIQEGLQVLIHHVRAGPYVGGVHADVRISLPDGLSFAIESALVDDYVPIRGASVGKVLAPRVDLFLPSFFEGCGYDFSAFFHENYPVDFVPAHLTYEDGLFLMTDVCQRPVVRHHFQAPDYPSYPSDKRGGRNGGLLGAGFSSPPGAIVSIGERGLSGAFTTSWPVEWTTSVPYAMNLRTSGEISIYYSGSVLASGRIQHLHVDQHVVVQNREGDLSMPAQQRDTALMSLTFHNATITERGTIRAQSDAQPQVAFGWLGPQGFTMTTSPHIDLLVPPVSHFDDTRYSIWPQIEDPVGLDVGVGRVALIDAGINVRTPSEVFWWGGCGAGLAMPTTAMDVYFRFGGVTGMFDGKVPPSTKLEVYKHNGKGYDILTDSFKVTFLDNLALPIEAFGEVKIPFPAQFGFQYSKLETGPDGCPRSLDIVSKTAILDYWDVVTLVAAARFADKDLKPDEDPRYLWVDGAYQNLGRLTDANGATATVPVSSAFRPDGHFVNSRVFQDGLPYRIDGMPMLLEGVRLSDAPGAAPGSPGEPPSPPPDANLLPVQLQDEALHGFVEVRGPLILPGFGLSKAPNQQPNDRARFRFYADPTTSGGGPPTPSGGGPIGTMGKGYAWTTAKHQVDRYVVQDDDNNVRMALDNIVYVPAGGGGGTQEYGTLIAMDRVPFGPATSPIFEMDVASILIGAPEGPVSGSARMGLASGVTALMATAQFDPQVDENGDFASQRDALRTRALGRLFTDAQQLDCYLALLGEVWSPGANDHRYIDTKLDASLGTPGTPECSAMGGSSVGALNSGGVDIDRLRGDLPLAGGFDGIELNVTVRIHQPFGNGDDLSLVAMKSAKMTMGSDGSVTLRADSARLLELPVDLPVDVHMHIDPAAKRFEAALAAGGWHLEGIHVEEATIVVGAGDGLFYLGASVAGTLGLGGSDIKAGGSVLVGTVSTDSPVLTANYPKLMKSLKKVPNGSGTTLDGFYGRVHGSVPIYDSGCFLRIHAGADFAVWMFWNANGRQIGGEFVGHAHGSVGCIGSARGQISLGYSNTSGQNVPSPHRLEGYAWFAAGVGWCSPSSWTTWNQAFSDDWCLVAGAKGDMVFENGAWDWDYSYEIG